MPSIASDSEEPDLACTMTAIGNTSISRVQVSRNFQIMINHKLDPVGPVAWGLPIMTAISQRIYDEMT